MTGRGSVSKLFIHFGMLCAALAFASWWTSHTILDTARTRRITEAVLQSADLRHFVAGHIASVTAPAVGVSASAATTNGAYTNHLDAVLGRRDIQSKLEQFVVDAHERLLGERSQPAVLDQATVRTLVAAAFPSVRAADLAKVHDGHVRRAAEPGAVQEPPSPRAPLLALLPRRGRIAHGRARHHR